MVFAKAGLLLREPARRESATTIAALRAIWRRRRLMPPLLVGEVIITMADSAASIWAAPVQ